MSKEKSDKKEKKEKRVSEGGVTKEKKEKKDKKKDRKSTDATVERIDDSVVADVDDMDVDAKADAPKPALVPFAVPLADEKASKKVLKTVKKASKARCLKRGVKEVVKAVRKSPAANPTTSPNALPSGIVVLAADISPMDVISHIPVLCEDHNIPYVFLPSRAELGAAGSTKRPTSVVMVTPKPSGTKKSEKTEGEDDWEESYGDLHKLMIKLGQHVKY